MTTIKTFCKKASGNVSAAAYLAAHREFLTQGAHAPIVAPILAGVDKGEQLPTPALREIAFALMEWELAKAAEPKPAKAGGGGGGRVKQDKPFTACLFDDRGRIEVDKGFDTESEAQAWIDRRLDRDAGPSWHGEINGVRVERDDALFRLYGRRKPGPVVKGGRKSAPLSNSMKVSSYHAHFSRG